MQIISLIKPNRKYITRLPIFLLSLNNYLATPIYIYMQSKCPEGTNGMQSRREKKKNSATLPAGQ